MSNAKDSQVSFPGMGWNFDNSYARLPKDFFAAAKPVQVREPKLTIFNESLAKELGLVWQNVTQDSLAALFAGQTLPVGTEPIAQAYAGHQYGGFTMLGDGRAILLGEQKTPSGERFDIQLKGAGPTAYSRRGDGRAVLGPMLREYIISEAMHHLGIPTTRSLAVVTTGESVYRMFPQPGAVLTRVAASHIRVGTFQFFAARRDEENLKVLAYYTIARHYPELIEAENRYLSFFKAVLDRQAKLIASWQLVGFVHGVMNTDNMAISGETIDYGPCAFLNVYEPGRSFSSIDEQGRYAYGNQPNIAQWNLARFAETLLPLIDADQNKAITLATQALSGFADLFAQYWFEGLRKKLGLITLEEDDFALAQTLLSWMEESRADYTNTFRDLGTGSPLKATQYQDEAFGNWYQTWQARLERNQTPKEQAYELMNQNNPAVLPRNHKVEAALQAAETEVNLTPFLELLQAVQSPFTANPKYQDPPANDSAYRTFCGT
jgi:serine/tyrosine/threonine adenylyltransferase